MRILVALLLASVVTAVAAEMLNVLLDQVILNRRPLALNERLVEVLAVATVWLFFVNLIVGLPVVMALKHFRLLRLPVVTAAGAMAGLALCAVLLLLPSSDQQVATSLVQQLMPWLKSGILGALSATVLGYVLMRGSTRNE